MHSFNIWQHECYKFNKKNLFMHSRTKHIDIKYHLLRDNVLKGDVKIIFIDTHDQLDDILTIFWPKNVSLKQEESCESWMKIT